MQKDILVYRKYATKYCELMSHQVGNLHMVQEKQFFELYLEISYKVMIISKILRAA